MKSRLAIFAVSIILSAAVSCSSPKGVSQVTHSERDGATVEAAAAEQGRDGSTFEKAIVVNSIREEYLWIEVKYPGAKVNRQTLVRQNGRPYDVLTFVTREGETKVVHFDISNFFGKGF